ncbi:hypothetical protein COH20_003325 [Aspergillus flavus]|uniref:Unnamed protein product n=1 Tax=Aspergillus oryzae var. brunneus TaxID=332754 RepID=A0ABQ6KJ97_ASPOZ|nr:hypothetical protein COH20_003325 [Aspergillus flavus]RAQ78601.1 hypothetical protein COH21_005424 [Aspergillus flavus]GMG45265.1 unnamed protein product [Aspergillus oryzae var. brunneus]
MHYWQDRHLLRKSQQEETEKPTQDDIEAIKQDKNLFRQAVQMLSEHLAHTARNIIRTDRVEDSDTVRKYDAETKDGTITSRGIVLIADEDSQYLETEVQVPVIVRKRGLTSKE